MPWRKYNAKKGKNGPSYHIGRGIQVRCGYNNQWTVFIERAGVRKNKTIGPGRDGLVKAIRAAEAIAGKMGPTGSGKIQRPPKARLPKFIDYGKKWLQQNEKRWDPLTYERYEQILRLHIRPYPLFNKAMDSIGRNGIKDHLRCVFKKRSPSTVEAVHSVISGIFEEAVDEQKVKVNPARGLLKKILPPKRQRYLKDADPFTRKERDLFLAKAQIMASWTEQLILKVMVHAGLRLGEALAMRVKHLDVKNMTYLVAESYKVNRFKKPKFGKTRFVDLPDFLVSELKDYATFLRKEGLKKGTGGCVDLLFVDPEEKKGWPYSQRKILYLVRRVCKAATLRVRNPHDLRHTYASIMLMAHQSPGYVQRQLGHSSISITMDIYCHWIPGEGRRGLEEALLGGQGQVIRPESLYGNRIKSHKLKERPK
jgi:integrase